LEGFAALEEVDIRDFDLVFRETQFLQLSSVATLARLTLLSHRRFTPPRLNWDALDAFVNLKSLSIAMTREIQNGSHGPTTT